MAELPKNVLAWFPEGASPPQAVGLFLMSGVRPVKMWDYREHLADRVEWMLENSDPEDLRLSSDLLLKNGILLEPALEPEELVEAVRAGVVDEQLSVLGVNPPQKGRYESPEFLKEVFLLEWASSLVVEGQENEQPSLDNFTDAELDAALDAALGPSEGPTSAPNPDPAPVPPPPPTAGGAAAAAAQNAAKAIDEALTAIFKLLGGH